MKNNEKDQKKKIDDVMNILFSNTDPDGSYTGVTCAIDEDCIPIQDADDL